MARRLLAHLVSVWAELRACQWPSLGSVASGSLFVIYASFGLLAFLVCVDYAAEGMFGVLGVRERVASVEAVQPED